MIKTFLKTLFILFVFFQLGNSVWAQEQIQNFDTQIIINQDGTIGVEERITYDFGSLEKHGIYRNIPYIKTNKEGKKFKLEFENFSVTDETGSRYKYDKSVSSGKINLKIGDADKTITGVHNYIIRYRVSGALTYFSDHDELYWNVTGNGWPVPIEQARATVTSPAKPKFFN